ncbi:hypothetical protein ABT115_23940 [Streptomyces sp. NPDC001832]|uniref:hypothetical protein n=1 Tax=Streptomyces sp. NPDC001832 TaxID=3154527 RepID=UPI00332C1234
MAATPLRNNVSATDGTRWSGSLDELIVRSRPARGALAALRILLAWTFIWPFLDKVFGLGFSTKSADAVINGGSPTEGFLLYGTKGPFGHIFDSVAGGPFLDVLFMLGLLGIGLAFLLGIGIRVAAVSCAVMTGFMWLVTLQPANNPITDDHWMLALAGIVIATTHAGDFFGLGRKWKEFRLVRRYRWLV